MGAFVQRPEPPLGNRPGALISIRGRPMAKTDIVRAGLHQRFVDLQNPPGEIEALTDRALVTARLFGRGSASCSLGLRGVRAARNEARLRAEIPERPAKRGDRFCRALLFAESPRFDFPAGRRATNSSEIIGRYSLLAVEGKSPRQAHFLVIRKPWGCPPGAPALQMDASRSTLAPGTGRGIPAQSGPLQMDTTSRPWVAPWRARPLYGFAELSGLRRGIAGTNVPDTKKYCLKRTRWLRRFRGAAALGRSGDQTRQRRSCYTGPMLLCTRRAGCRQRRRTLQSIANLETTRTRRRPQ